MLANNPNVLGRGAKVIGGTTPGIGNVVGPASATDKALARFSGTTGKIIQNGVVVEADNTGNLTGATDQATTSAVGSAFTNQPSNDGVTVVSNSAADVTQVVTIIGTTTATNTVVTENITLTGTTGVPSVKVNWGQILAVKISASCAGTMTVKKTTGLTTIVAITTTNLSAGVNTVAAANQAAYNQLLSTVASGATTKQVGWGGTNTSGTTIYDSKALNGTTAVASNSAFFTLTEIYTGDVENTRTVTVTTTGTWTLTGGGGAVLSFVTGSTGASFSGALGLAGQNPTGGTGVLQFPAATTSAGGITFGADTSFYRSGAGVMVFGSTGTNTSKLIFLENGSSSGTPYIQDAGGALTINTNGTIALQDGGATGFSLNGSHAATFVAKISSYNGVTTAGWGVPAVYADGNIAATANARSAAVATYTVGAADGTFVVSGAILINSGSAFSFSLDCVYTDAGNTSRTLVLPLAQLAGTFVATGLATNVTGTGPYESASMTIRCKASTSITIRPSAGGTYTTVNYDCSGNIRQVG